MKFAESPTSDAATDSAATCRKASGNTHGLITLFRLLKLCSGFYIPDMRTFLAESVQHVQPSCNPR